MIGQKRSLWSLTAVASVLFSLSLSPAQSPPPSNVLEVRVEGNKHMSTAAVLSRIKTRVGEPYNDKIVKEDERRLLESGRFESVLTTKAQAANGVIVTFSVSEWPTINKLEFLGAKAFRKDVLAKELLFGVGDAMNRFNVEAGRQAILNKYHSKGFHLAQVSVDNAALRRNQVIYQIVEGPQSHISKLRFEGNDFFNNLKLRFSVNSSSKFWPFEAGYLDNEKIERDVNALRNLYVAEGFLDAEVGRKLDFSPDKKKVILTFLIHQGPRYRINRLTIKGTKVFSEEELAKRLELRQGKFYTADSLKRDTEMLEHTYGELGYIEAAVSSRTRFMAPDAPTPEWARGFSEGGKPALLNLEFEIKESDQYRVGRVDIRGNSITQSRVIRRELRFYPEQLYNTVAVELSKSRLKETWLFEDVNITPVGKEPNIRDALVQVKEGKTAEFLVGVGVSSNSGLLGNVSFTQRNFDMARWPATWNEAFGDGWKGAGETFRITAEPGTELMRFSTSWNKPYLYDLPYSLNIDAYYWTHVRESYDESRLGTAAAVGHRFQNRWYGELSWRVEEVRIDNIDETDTPPEIRNEEGNHFLTGPKFSLVRDRTDSRWMPTTGDRLSLAYEQILGSSSFGRPTMDYRIYRTVYTDALDRKHVLSGKVSSGYILGSAPFFERFYAGGTGTVRGFKFRTISPRDYNNATHEYWGDPVGGKFLFLAGTEYSYPIISDNFRGVLFLDTGTVEREFEVTTYRASIGTGVRWMIPLLGPVPLALDLAIPLSKGEEDDTQLVSFNMGWTF